MRTELFLGARPMRLPLHFQSSYEGGLLEEGVGGSSLQGNWVVVVMELTREVPAPAPLCGRRQAPRGEGRSSRSPTPLAEGPQLPQGACEALTSKSLSFLIFKMR